VAVEADIVYLAAAGPGGFRPPGANMDEAAGPGAGAVAGSLFTVVTAARVEDTLLES